MMTEQTTTTGILRRLWDEADRLEERLSRLPLGMGTVHLEGGTRVRGHLLLTEHWVTCLLNTPNADGADRSSWPRERVLRVDFDFPREESRTCAAEEAEE